MNLHIFAFAIINVSFDIRVTRNIERHLLAAALSRQIQLLPCTKKSSSVVRTFHDVPLRHFSHLTSPLFLSFCHFFFPAPIVGSCTAPFWSVTNETKIKCKWKFIAAGDRRRFCTFKYFINFLLLLLLASVLVVPRSARRVTIEGVLWKGTKRLRDGARISSLSVSIFPFPDASISHERTAASCGAETRVDIEGAWPISAVRSLIIFPT